MDRSSNRLRIVPTLLVVLCAIPCLAEGDAPVEEENFTPPADLERGWYARIETTMGRIIARLLPGQAPQSVAHFAGLSEGTLPWIDLVSGETRTDPYYDGMMIHTVMAGRFFETGDAGSMGGATPPMFVPEEGAGPLNFSMPYMLGMTRIGGGRISAVKFFVTVSAQPWLTGDNPCFGQVVEGQEIVFNISQVKAYSNRRPLEDLFIEKIRIFTVGDPAPLPEPVPHKPTRTKLEFRGAPDPSQ